MESTGDVARTLPMRPQTDEEFRDFLMVMQLDVSDEPCRSEDAAIALAKCVTVDAEHDLVHNIWFAKPEGYDVCQVGDYVMEVALKRAFRNLVIYFRYVKQPDLPSGMD